GTLRRHWRGPARLDSAIGASAAGGHRPEVGTTPGSRPDDNGKQRPPKRAGFADRDLSGPTIHPWPVASLPASPSLCATKIPSTQLPYDDVHVRSMPRVLPL